MKTVASPARERKAGEGGEVVWHERVSLHSSLAVKQKKESSN